MSKIFSKKSSIVKVFTLFFFIGLMVLYSGLTAPPLLAQDDDIAEDDDHFFWASATVLERPESEDGLGSWTVQDENEDVFMIEVTDETEFYSPIIPNQGQQVWFEGFWQESESSDQDGDQDGDQDNEQGGDQTIIALLIDLEYYELTGILEDVPDDLEQPWRLEDSTGFRLFCSIDMK